MSHSRLTLLAVFALLVVACSDNVNKGGGGINCSDDEFYDQVNDTCVPRNAGSDGGVDAGSDIGDGTDADSPDASTPEDGGDDDGGIDPACDQDGDGVASMACGGDDCDDNATNRSPELPEFCDDVDNDCNGQINDGITCTFYAHSGTNLYEVDPFEKEATQLAENLPNLLDIDTHPDGTLFGITYDGLYEFDTGTSNWTKVGEFGIDVGDPNGLAIDSFGTAYASSEDKIYTIDTNTGYASLLGELMGMFYSSGDTVVNAKDTFFLTSKHDPDEDYLVKVDRMTGVGTSVGPIGFQNVFALTAAWGVLYGMTDAGELIEINIDTGEGTLIHTFQNIRWFGAASTPSR